MEIKGLRNIVLYNVSVWYRVPGISTVIEADNQAQAESIAHKMASDKLAEISKENIIFDQTVRLSEQSYLFSKGGMSWVKRYRVFRLATCSHSGCWRAHYTHSFNLIENKDIYVHFKGKRDTLTDKVQEICKTGKIGTQCDNCKAKFACFTKARV